MTQKEVNSNTELDTSIFRERFVRLREEHQMSQAQFAVFLGIPSGSVGGYENGTKFPNGKTLFTIATKCDVSADYLLGLHSNPVLKEDVHMICDYTGLNEKAIKHLHKHIKFAPSDADILSFLIAPNSISRYFNDLVNITLKLRYYQETYLEIVSKLSSIENQINNLSQKEIEDILDDIEIEMKDAKIFYYDVFEEFRLLIDDFNKLYVKTPDNEALVMDCITEMNTVLEGYYNGEHT